MLTASRTAAVFAAPLQLAPCRAGDLGAVTMTAPPQPGKTPLAQRLPASTPTASSPPPLANVSPLSQHQLPVHDAHVPPGSHSSPVSMRAPPHLASEHSTVHNVQPPACDDACIQQQGTVSLHHEQASLASSEDHPFNSTSSTVPQRGLSPGAHMLYATVEDSPVSTAGNHDADTEEAAEASQQAVSAAGPPVMQATNSQADASEVSLPVEQKCQVPLPVPVTRSSGVTDAPQVLASGFTDNKGKPVAVAGVVDKLGCKRPAQTAPEDLPGVLAHAACADKTASPCRSRHKALAAVASGVTTAAGKPVNVSARAQADAQRLLGNGESGQNPMEPMPAHLPTLTPSAFSTGTGRAVQVSTAAMARAQMVLADPDDSSTDEQAVAVASEPPSTAVPAVAPSGFSTGTGKAVLTSAAAVARAQTVLADDSTAGEQAMGAGSEPPKAAAPAAAPSGFTSGTGKAVLMSAAARARAKSIFADDNTAAEQARDAVSEPPSATAVVPSGFSTGSGRAVLMSAAAKARAKSVFADDSTAAEQATDVVSEPPSAAAPTVVPSGFSTGSGKAVQFSAAAKARAENFFADDGTAAEQTTEAAAEPPSTAAPTPAPSGFSSGTGKSVPISAAAQAQARSMFQDENAAPLHPGTDVGSSSTPAGSSSRPGRKAAGAKPVVGTPRTGPPTGKPVMRRVKELSQSTGGKLFKKPRMSKIVSPFCPGATPARVRPDCGYAWPHTVQNYIPNLPDSSIALLSQVTSLSSLKRCSL